VAGKKGFKKTGSATLEGQCEITFRYFFIEKNDASATKMATTATLSAIFVVFQ
jgi:hypothetical protein